MTLVACYTFGLQDSNGTLHDISGNGHHGQYFGQPVFGVPGIGGPGVLFGNDLVWGETDDYAEIPSHPDFSIGNDGLTITASIAPSTMNFPGSPAPLYPGYPAANYISFLNKCGDASTGNPNAEWLLRLYPNTAVATYPYASRESRLSAYAFSPDAGLGAGAYHQPAPGMRIPGVYIDIKAQFEPVGQAAGGARVRLWVDGTEVPWSPAAKYSAYNVVPVAGPEPVRIGAGFLDSVPVQFRGSFARLSFHRGLV